jgi:tRNA modification GTPase
VSADRLPPGFPPDPQARTAAKLSAPSLDDTIVAIATPPGRGGLGAVRLSGPRAAEIAAALFSRGGASEAGRARFGTFRAADGEAIDRGYLVLFHPPRSFTGEEVAECWTHGSPAVLRALVEAAAARGARPAEPGEFTWRALVRGRIDLTQAEGVRDLIEARTLFAARLAHLQEKGRLSARLQPVRQALADLLARAEASIEFGEEPEIAAAPPEADLAAEAARLAAELERLAGSYERGRLLREGARVVLAGLPNAGKSSLFNRLLGEARAIVTPVPGTTRDAIEETIDLRGMPIVLTDTAGLHETANEADREAVVRARARAAEADLVVVVLDWSRAFSDADRDTLAAVPPGRLVAVLNKVDLPCGIGLDRVLALRRRTGVLEVSAKSGEGIDDLRRRLHERLEPEARLLPDEAFLTSLRQRDLAARAATALARAAGAARDRLGAECTALDLREALDALGGITGVVDPDDVYRRIFSTFCIGK